MRPSSPFSSSQTRTAHASGLVLDVLTADQSRSILLYEGEWTIGTQSSNHIIVEGPGIQDRHCRVLIDGDMIVVQAWADDTFVNGIRVEEAPLAAGDLLTLGSATMNVRQARPDELLAQLPTVTPGSQKAAAQSLRNKTLQARISSTANLLDLLEFEFGQIEPPPTDPLDRAIDRIERGMTAGQAAAKAKTARYEESFFSLRNQMGELTELLQAQFEGIDHDWQSRVQFDVDAIVAQAWAAESTLSGSHSFDDASSPTLEAAFSSSGSGLLVQSVRPDELLAQIPCISSSPLSGTLQSRNFAALLTCIGSIANSLDRLESDFPTEAPLDRAIDRIQRGLPSAEAAARSKSSRCAETFIAIRHELEELTEVLQCEFEGDGPPSLPAAESADLDTTGFERERAQLDAASNQSEGGDSDDQLQTTSASGDVKLDIDRLFKLSESLSHRTSFGSRSEKLLEEVDRGLSTGDRSGDGDESHNAGVPAKAAADDSNGAVVAEGHRSEAASKSKMQAERQKLERYARMIDESSVERSDTESCQDEDAVAIGSGAILIRINSIENVLRSRNEAVRQLDELLLSHAESDPEISEAFSKSRDASGRHSKSLREATFDFDSGESLCPDSPDGDPDGSQDGSMEALAEQLSEAGVAVTQGVCDDNPSLAHDASAVASADSLPSNAVDSQGPLSAREEIQTLIAEHVATDVFDVDSVGSEGTLATDEFAAELLDHSEGLSDVEGSSNDSTTRVRLLEAAIAQEVESSIDDTVTAEAAVFEDDCEQLEDSDVEAESSTLLTDHQETGTIDPDGDDSQSLLLRSQLADMFGISKSLERLARTADEDGVEDVVEVSDEADVEATSEYAEEDQSTQATEPTPSASDDASSVSELDGAESEDIASDVVEDADNDFVEDVQDEECDSPESAIDTAMSSELFATDDSKVEYFEPDESHADDDLDDMFSLFSARKSEAAEIAESAELVESAELTELDGLAEPIDEIDATSPDAEAALTKELPAVVEAEVRDDFEDVEEPDSDALPRLFGEQTPELLGLPGSGSDVPHLSDERQTLTLRSQLADLFGMNAAPSSRPEVEPQQPAERSQAEVAPTEKASVPSEPKAAEPAVPVDPIRAYMEQLLARNRKQAPSENVRVAAPDPVTVSQQPQPEVTVEMSKTRATSTEWLNQGPTHKQDKDAVRANMQQLRALANQQARSAVVRAGKKQMRLQMLTKSGAALLSLLFGGAALFLKVPPLYGFACMGLGVLFTIDLVITVFRNSRNLSKQERLIQDWVDEESHVKANSRTEDRLSQFTRAAHSDSHSHNH